MAADNNKHELNIMQRCCVGVLWLLCRTVAVTPRIIRYYVLQEIIYFVMHYVIRYRRGVVMTNLRNSFPDKGGARAAAHSPAVRLVSGRTVHQHA